MTATAAAPAAGLEGPTDDAEDFGVAHFEIGGTICGGVGGDLGVQAAELIPAPAVGAEVGERVEGGVEGHSEDLGRPEIVCRYMVELGMKANVAQSN